MLFVPYSADFKWNATSSDVRPATNYGTALTPGNNTQGTPATLISGATITEDVWGILINFNSAASSNQARNILVNILADPAGGTSYTTTLIASLLGSCAAPYNIGNGGIWYYFPLGIPAGYSIGASAAVNNATVGTIYAQCWVFGQPRRPDIARRGRFVIPVGATTATSSGAPVTPGTTAEGAWAELGTLERSAWWWQMGFGVSDNSMTVLAYHCDLAAGDASNKNDLVINQLVTTTSTEQMNNMLAMAQNNNNVASGSIVYGRAWCSGTPDSNVSMIAYALGG